MMDRRAGTILVALLLLGGCATGGWRSMGVSSAQNGSSVVSVRGLDERSLESLSKLTPEQREAALRVWVADTGADSPAVLGEVARRESELVFTPRYPFQPGLKYRARFDPGVFGKPGAVLQYEFVIPAPAQEPVAKVMA